MARPVTALYERLARQLALRTSALTGSGWVGGLRPSPDLQTTPQHGGEQKEKHSKAPIQSQRTVSLSLSTH